MSLVVAGRMREGVEVPAAGTWEVDPSHSSVGFIARHLMLAKVGGSLRTFAGTIHVAEEPEASWAEVTIDPASVDTRDEKRDAHLRSPDFFDVEAHPVWTFRSAGLSPTGPTTFELSGELTIHGVTRPVALAVVFEGLTADPWGNTRAVFSAETEIDREAFGLSWNAALETGGVLVGRQVMIQLEIEAVRAA